MPSDAHNGPGESRVGELLDDNSRLREELARFRGQIEALQERLSAQDAADEHHRVELETAKAETADALANLKEAQVRVESGDAGSLTPRSAKHSRSANASKRSTSAPP